jgi:hypothetical protein
MSLAAADLDALDALMTRAFATGDASRLDVLGYGEMTTVVAFASGGKRYACKRLPPFATAQDADRYAALFDEYVATLTKSGMRVVPSSLQFRRKSVSTVSCRTGWSMGTRCCSSMSPPRC